MYSGEEDQIEIAKNGDVCITTDGDMCQYSMKEDQAIQIEEIPDPETVKKETTPEEKAIVEAADPIKVGDSPNKKFMFPTDDGDDAEDIEMNDREGEEG